MTAAPPPDPPPSRADPRRAALPIDAALPELLAALDAGASAVLVAPPGAGKTTRVPLALLEKARWRGDGRIVMLEPRRLAARAAAERLADTLGEPVGQRVGYRIRHESKIGPRTRLDVATEGVLTRMIQSDPGLSDIAAVIFDEFHERSIHADLGLALCLEIQSALRPDLRLLAMSATLDGARVAELMGAAVIRSEGRAFPVTTRWRDTPLARDDRAPGRFERIVARAAADALGDETAGDALVFLPGAREIGQSAAALSSILAADGLGGVEIAPLYGDLPAAEQARAVAPARPDRRRVILSTAIAETSLTIDGVRIVVDAGRARRARFDAATGMNRLVTGPVSRAAADQRRGRAGRTAPGLCVRLWSRGEEGALPAFDAPEILEADLAGLALELAAWGARPQALPWLDPPPQAAFAQAEALLRELGALDPAGGLTEHGRRLAAAPLHPRLAQMTLRSGGARDAFGLAALLEDRDPLRGRGRDVTERLAAIADPARAGDRRGAVERLRESANRLSARMARAARAGEAGGRGGGPDRAGEPRSVRGPLSRLSAGALIALGYPDRIAARRPGQTDDPGARRPVRYITSGGRGVELPADDPLARCAFLAVAALSFPEDSRRRGGDPTISLAAPLDLNEVDALFGDRISWREVCAWSKRDGQVLARRERRLGAIVLQTEPTRDAAPDALAEAMTEGVRQLGLAALPWTPAARRLQARVAAARRLERTDAPEPPDLSDAHLTETLESWLTPYLAGMKTRADLQTLDMASLLNSRLADALGRDGLSRLERALPDRFVAPSGQSAPIDYAGAQPKVQLRLQALLGLDRHPQIAGQPLLIEMLSPANRPIQLTADLPGFWRGSYADVRKDMRARYPKHDWPENPAAAAPRRARPRA